VCPPIPWGVGLKAGAYGSTESGLSSLQLSVMWSVGYYTSPLLVTFLYRRGYLVTDSLPTLAKITTSVGLIVIISLVMRGLGRKQSRSYSNMMKALVRAKASKTAGDANSDLRRFDIEFNAWPVDFDVKALTG